MKITYHKEQHRMNEGLNIIFGTSLILDIFELIYIYDEATSSYPQISDILVHINR